MPGPLHGVRILELAHVIIGPYACQILADMGAEVIKIEPPTGDKMRTLGAVAHSPDMASLFLACNRNKRSLVLDLKKKSARGVVLKLAETSDVVVHNNRPQVMTKLGLDYADFKAVSPHIIYCGAYGYSKNGPYGERGALDEAIQASGGIADLNGRANGVPRSVPTALADKINSITVAYAVLGALIHRSRTGRGQDIEVPMMETMVNYVMAEHLWGMGFEPPLSGPGYAPLISPKRQPMRTKDGYVAILTSLDPHWEIFCTRTGRADLLTDPRFATAAARVKNADATYGETAKVLATHTTQHWMDMFKDTSVPITTLSNLEDLITDPHLDAVGFWQISEHPTEGRVRMPSFPIRYSKTPAEIRRHPPNLGEHSVEVLQEAGLTRQDIDSLLADGTTAQKA